MSKLDLHGIKHSDAKDIVYKFIDNHVLENKQVTIEIITGYSDRMKEIVYEVLYDYKLEAVDHEFNKGMLVVKL
jgi:hypothetical protein